MGRNWLAIVIGGLAVIVALANLERGIAVAVLVGLVTFCVLYVPAALIRLGLRGSRRRD